MEASSSWSESTVTEIRGENVNLQSAMERSMDCSGIDLDCTFRRNDSYIDSGETEEDGNTYETSSSRKNKNKRSLEITSPEEGAKRVPNIVGISRDLSKVESLIFMKGLNGNLAKLNPLKLKKALLVIDSSLKDEQIKYAKESLKIKCRDDVQKNLLLNVTELAGIDVSTSIHNAVSRASVDLETYEKIIIFGVSTEISESDICEETHSVAAKRLFKKDGITGERTPSENVILSFSSKPPKFAQIGFQSFKAKEFIPLPLRCWRCQRFGHSEKACRGKVTCPRCAKEHTFEECPLSSSGTNESSSSEVSNLFCVNCHDHHSAAYRLCPAYIKSKEITHIKTVQKITYAEAAKQLNENSLADRQGQLQNERPEMRYEGMQRNYEGQKPHQGNPHTSSIFLNNLMPIPTKFIREAHCPSNTIPNYPPLFTGATNIPVLSSEPIATISNDIQHEISDHCPNVSIPNPGNKIQLDNFLVKFFSLLIQFLGNFLPRDSIVSKFQDLLAKVNVEPLNSSPLVSSFL